MSRRKFTCDGNTLTITDGQLFVAIDLAEVAESLDDISQQEFADAICWDWVLDEAIRRLTGDSRSWGGADHRITAKVLAKMERFACSRVDIYLLTELNALARDLAAHEHLYWKLYRSEDIPDGRGYLRGGQEWLLRHKIESNYTTKLPEFRALMDLVQSRIDKALDPIPGPPPAEVFATLRNIVDAIPVDGLGGMDIRPTPELQSALMEATRLVATQMRAEKDPG